MIMAPILLSGPDVTTAERCAVAAAVDTGWIAPLGPAVDTFEAQIAARVGRRHAVALSSGTAALHLGLLAHGVGPGHVVPTTTMTFAATVNAIVYTGATPYLVDVDPTTGQMDPALLDEVLDELRRQGKDVPVVLPVDLLGRCADHTAITAIAHRAGAKVLVDAAESLGASRDGVPAGGHGDAAIFSFNGNKIITTSGGGMYLTDHEADAARVRYLATQAREPVAHYEHRAVGYNYRLSNLLAALGSAQLDRLDSMLERRRERREAYARAVADLPGIEVFQRAGDEGDSCWLTALLLDPEVAGVDIGMLGAALTAAGIESRPLWKPMHLQPVFTDLPSRITGAAERLFRTGIALPSGSALRQDERDRIDEVLGGFLDGHFRGAAAPVSAGARDS